MTDPEHLDVPPVGRERLVFVDNRVTRLIERFAIPLFGLVALLYLVSFNGKWRLGLDSANYRGLADSIASGRGYVFGDWAGKSVYPGLPLLLAGLQKVFGRDDFAPMSACVVMLLMSALTLLVTYLLIRLHYPKWVAVTITFGAATNAWFLQQSSELMTDVPFLLGVVTALYGWDLLKRDAKPRAASISLLLIGLLLAASMRPTFLVLVGAWGLTCLIGVVFAMRPSRRFYLTALLIMLAVWIVMAALDPRVRGFHPLAGGYEREASELLSAEESGRFGKLVHVLNKQLPSGFFGEQLSLGSINHYSPSAIFLSAVLIASIGLLARRHLLWALWGYLAVLTTIIYADEPRYYLMILPVLLLAWLRMLLNISSLLPKPWSELLLFGGLTLVTLNNLSSSIAFVKEQRSTPFLEHYRNGKMLPTVRMAELIKQRAKFDETVLGPSGSIMSFLSGRHVYTQREILPRRGHVSAFPRIFHNKHISYAVFPASLYRDKEPSIAHLMERGVLRPGGRIAEISGMRLAQLRVYVPKGDWTRLPRLGAAKPQAPGTTQRKMRRPTTTRPRR